MGVSGYAFKINSIRGRYLFAAAFFIVYLISTAFFLEIQIKRAIASTVQTNQEQQLIRMHLDQITDLIWNYNFSLLNFMISPSESAKVQLYQKASDIIQEANNLVYNGWINKKPGTLKTAKSIIADFHHLQIEIQQIAEMRTDPNLLFTASSILSEQMLPANNEFMLHLNIAKTESATSRPQRKIRELLFETELNWLRMVGAFRLYIASRFGVFPSTKPNTHAKGQENNITVYSKHVEMLLSKLTTYQKYYDFQQNDSIPRLMGLHKKWLKGFEKAAKTYQSQNWRSDLPILDNKINPLFTTLWEKLQRLESFLNSETLQEVENLSKTASILNTSFWLISTCGILITLLCLWYFDRSIRKPIDYVSNALALQAKGETAPIKLDRAQITEETEYLVQAFYHMQNEVNHRQQRLQAILDNAAEGIITFDTSGTVRSANKSFLELFSYTEQELHGKNVSVIMPEFYQLYSDTSVRLNIDSGWMGIESELTGRNKYHEEILISLRLSEYRLKGQRHYIGLIADISERKAFIQHLQHMADHDSLTHLQNRAAFERHLEDALSATKKYKRIYALLYIDLDNFKYVNDTISHSAGDKLLIDVAELLSEQTGMDDVLARFGGDEFTMLKRVENAAEALSVAEEIRDRLSTRIFVFDTKQINVTCSLGILLLNESIDHAREAFSKVDIACHVAKKSGRNRVHLFSQNNQDDVTAMATDIGWSRIIKNALMKNQFVLAAQPILHIAEQRLLGYEILVRLRDENGSLVYPGGFMPSAERFGLAGEIDKWVIRNAMANIKELGEEVEDLQLHINLSGQTLNDYALCDIIRQAIQDYRIAPKNLTFEITETVAIANIQAAETILKKIQELGCKTALDDFGVGMSSFAYLKELPVDILKIDGRFVKDVHKSLVNKALIKAMTDVAHALSKKTVAEFVQDQQTVSILRELGVDYAQGHFVGEPVLICELLGNQTQTLNPVANLK